MRSQMQWIITEFKCFTRNFISMFFTLLFPPMFLVLFGEIYGNEPAALFGGIGTVDAQVPAYICMVICVSGIMSLPITLTGYRERKILKRFRASPASPMQIITAQLAVNLVMTAAGAGLLILIAVFRYDMNFEGNWFTAIFAFFLSIFSIFSIGFLIASLIRNAKAAMAVSNIIYFPMLFLSGATIPIETMPDSIKDISRFIPLARAVEIMKASWQGNNIWDNRVAIFILAGTGAVCSVISIIFFRWE